MFSNNILKDNKKKMIKKISKNKIKIGNRIGSVMVSLLASSAIDCGYELRSCLEQKNIKLVFVASSLRTQH